MSKKKKIAFYTIASLSVLFICSYIYMSDTLLNNTDSKEQAVYNDGEKALKDDLRVFLYTEENKDSQTTITEISKKEGGKVITEGVLKEIFKKDGYTLSQKDETSYTFKRSKEASLEKNVFYLGVSNECIALFKTDDKGSLNLVKAYDYPVSILPKVDRENLEQFNYFSSPDMNEIERKLSEFGVKF